MLLIPCPFCGERHEAVLLVVGCQLDAGHVAVLVDVNHRRGPDAAIGDRWSELGFELNIGEIVGAIVNPDVVVFVDSQPGDAQLRLGVAVAEVLGVRASRPDPPMLLLQLVT